MGAPATRITAADFLTPPEFRTWKLAANPAGRIGGVRIQLSGDGSQTRLTDVYQQVPLRLLPPFQVDAAEPALLYLLNPTAGLMDGDAQLVSVSAGAGSRAVITGQSATRLHPCLNSFATQQWNIAVEPGAVLVLLPGPAIPFQGSRYFQRASIELAEGAALVWADIWFAGRYARQLDSEQFQFATLIQELTVHRKGRLIFRDRFCWNGPWDTETAAWHFGGGPACGSVFVSAMLGQELQGLQPVCPSASFATAAGDTCLRFCGDSEAVTASVVGAALHAAAILADAKQGYPWLLSSNGLGPNHWFSKHKSG